MCPYLPCCVWNSPSGLVVGKVETACPILVLHHVAPRTGGCHRQLVTGTVAVHMKLVVVIQPPCRRSDSPRVQQYFVYSLFYTWAIHLCNKKDMSPCLFFQNLILKFSAFDQFSKIYIIITLVLNIELKRL